MERFSANRIEIEKESRFLKKVSRWIFDQLNIFFWKRTKEFTGKEWNLEFKISRTNSTHFFKVSLSFERRLKDNSLSFPKKKTFRCNFQKIARYKTIIRVIEL